MPIPKEKTWLRGDVYIVSSKCLINIYPFYSYVENTTEKMLKLIIFEGEIRQNIFIVKMNNGKRGTYSLLW